MLNVRVIERDEQVRYDELMAVYHRRGALRRIGHELHYVVEDRGVGLRWRVFRRRRLSVGLATVELAGRNHIALRDCV